MSRVVSPRAYSDKIMSSTWPSRRRPFGTILGSNDPFLSRGTSIRTGPPAVVSVLPYRPLRELPDPFPAGSPCTYPR